MDFRKLTDDLNIISALGDNPNADNALTPSGLKAKFDEAALKIKHFLNEVLIPDLYTAVESEEFRGKPGLSPTVEAERFQDSTGSGVKLVITTPAPPDSGLLDSIISIPLYDGANGVTPKISNVDIEVLEYGADASAEISGPTNNLNLLLKIPRGETGRDGQTPAFQLASAYMLPYDAYPEVTISGPTAALRLTLGIPAGAPGPAGPQGESGPQGEPGPQGVPGKSPTVSVSKKRLSDGRMEATIGVINADGSSQSATVTDGKDGLDAPQDAVRYTAQTLTEEQKAQARENIGAIRETNCKIIAHRGYHVTAAQNTIDAFNEAVEAGFHWLEIDIHKCADGTYILSHDYSITLYNNGVPVSITIAGTAYSDIKGYTWDADGKYKLCTLQAVFNTMKVHDVHMICDKKSGENGEIMQIAALCGVVDKVMLSYYSFSHAYSEKVLLKKYDNVPIRCIPCDYVNFEQMATELRNPIYADVNASHVEHYQKYLNTALSCGIPILFAGCTLGNTSHWAVLAAGCMANDNLNITHAEFIEAVTNDFDNECTITLSENEVELALTKTASITATSDFSGVSGYVYAYSTNPAIASVAQKTFGNSVTIDITANEIGNVDVIFFSGNGERVKLPVSITEEDTGAFTAVVGGFNASDMSYSPSRKDRACLNPCMFYVDSGATVRITIPDGIFCGPSSFTTTVTDMDFHVNTSIAGQTTFSNLTMVQDAGWKNPGTFDLILTNETVIGFNFRRPDYGEITGDDIAAINEGFRFEVIK